MITMMRVVDVRHDKEYVADDAKASSPQRHFYHGQERILLTSRLFRVSRKGPV